MVRHSGCTPYNDSSNVVTKTFFPIPAVSLGLPDTVECATDTTLLLSGGSPAGGTYSGAGVTGTNFDASAAGVGTHGITYSYTDGNGCTNTATDSIEVLVSICSAAIGNYVWEDENEDGIQDGPEPGIEGVTVYIYNDSDSLINTTTTDASGLFLFNSIEYGTYYLVFDVSTNSGGNPYFKGTMQHIGPATTDSDPNPATGRTSLFLFDPSLGDDLTMDAGFILSCPPEPRGATNIFRY